MLDKMPRKNDDLMESGAEKAQSVQHPIPPVWNEQSKVLILGTMPSPASRKAGFFYMHPQNRFWKVLPALFDEEVESEIAERRNFLLRHKIALWDVLASCEIQGAADSSIKNAVPNDFTPLFEKSKITRVFCTGKTAFNLWNKFCAQKYESLFGIKCECLPSTSSANAAWSLQKLIKAYQIVRMCMEE